MPSRLLLAISLLLLLSSVASAVVIAGKVVEPESGRPAAGIVVQAEHHENRSRDKPDSFVVRRTTGDDGRFRLELPTGDAEYMVFVSGADGHIYEGHAHLARDTDLGTVELKRGCALSGAVRDQDYAPVPEVEVIAHLRLLKRSCEHWLEAERTRTAEDGTFEFPDLSPGEYQCRVLASAFEPAANTVEVSGGFSYLEFLLTPGCSIRGRVLGPGDRPVPGVLVRADSGRSARTNEKGEFLLSGLAAGDRELTVVSDDYRLPGNVSAKVTCASGETAGRDLRVGPTGTLQIVLTVAEAGATLPKTVSAELVDPEEWEGHPDLSADVVDGVATFPGLAAGEYTLTAEGEGIVEDEGEVTIEPGKTARAEVEVVRVFRVRGEVVDGDGNPVADASVSCERKPVESGDPLGSPGADTYLWARADEAGGFVLDNVPTGAFTLQVHHQALRPLQMVLMVGPDMPETVRCVLKRGVAISGSALEADGSAATGVRVDAHGPEGADNGVWRVGKDHEPAPDGSFKLQGLAPGRYTVVVRDQATHQEILRMPGVTAPTDELVIVLGQRYTIPGTVTDADGKALGNVAIRYERVMEFEFFSGPFGEPVATTDDQGRFTLTLRAGGRYEVSAVRAPFLPATVVVDLRDDPQQPPSKLELRLETGGTVRGTAVRAKDGVPVPGLTVRVEPDDESAMLASWDSDGEEAGADGAQTDDQGRFELTGVPYGVVTLVVTSGGDQRTPLTHKHVHARRDQAAETRIEIPETGAIRGRVLDEAGQPLGDWYVFAVAMTFPQRHYGASADARGTFEFANVPEGSYSVLWSRQGADDPQDDLPVEVTGGKTTEVTLSTNRHAVKGSGVKGVLTKSGQPAGPGELDLYLLPGEGATARDSPMMWPRTRHAEIAANGTFSVRALSAGPYLYTVQLTIPGGDEPPPGMAGMVRGRVDVAADQAKLVIALGGSALSGTVTDAEGRPVAGANVNILPTDAPHAGARPVWLRGPWARTDGNGLYSIGCLSAGTYDVWVHHKSGAMFRRGVTVTEAPLTLDIAFAGGVRLSGRVTEETGGSPRGTHVLVLCAVTREIAGFERVDHDGSYEVEQALPAGDYDVYVVKDGYATAGRRITLSADTRLDAALVPGGSIRVRLTDGEVRGRTVHVTDANGRELVLNRDASLAKASGPEIPCLFPTDSNGVTVVQGVPPGTYTIAVDGSERTVTVTVKPLETVEAELSLAPTP